VWKTGALRTTGPAVCSIFRDSGYADKDIRWFHVGGAVDGEVMKKDDDDG